MPALIVAIIGGLGFDIEPANLTAVLSPVLPTSPDRALLAALPLSARAEQSESVRAMGRTWFAVALLGGGAAGATIAAFADCSDSHMPPIALTCSQRLHQVGSLAGLAAFGALFATVWSDVPLARNFSVQSAEGGVQPAAAFRF